MGASEENSGTTEVRDQHRFDPAPLERWMAAHVAGFAAPISIRQFKGGQSNPTYRVDAPSGSYVLRRKPPGKLLAGAHAIDREYRVIDTLGRQAFPVPLALGLCADVAVIGTEFYVMELGSGLIDRARR